MRIFKKNFGQNLTRKKKDIPDGLWNKCNDCGRLIFSKVLAENLMVCPKCDFHFPINCWERVEQFCDKESFKELFIDLFSQDPLEFCGTKSYKDKLKEDQDKTGLKDAVIVGTASVLGAKLALAITDSRFIMGSMGSVVGEKITRITEYALENKLPLAIISGSGGGARMYEGMFSLMQMAKTCAALAKLKQANILYLSILTHPTMAGIMASFAGIGDITIAEPKALIGFTGPRVIKQTIKQDLPKGFQTAEFNLEHGMVDMVVARKDLKARVSALIGYVA